MPLALPVISSDLGLGAAGILIYTVNRPGAEPFKSQWFFSAARTNLGFEIATLRFDVLRFLDTSIRLKGGVGVSRNPNRRYYGYGNIQFPGRNRKIETGEIAVGANIPDQPDFIKGDELSVNTGFLRDPANAFNPGRRLLRESQNKYFRYDFRRQNLGFTLEDWFAGTKLKWKLGAYFNRDRVDTYQGDREENNTVPNTATLLDLERPAGYGATEKARWVNALVAGLSYNTVPPARETHPNRGYVVGGRTEIAGPLTGADYSFERYTIFWNHYFELFHEYFASRKKELILALRVFAQESAGNLPFYHETGLGGRTLRGYPARQFVDRVLVTAGGELRYTFARFEAAGGTELIGLVYFDQGRAAPSKREISGRDWHRSVGVGIGALLGGNALLEFAVGRSRFETYFELSFGHTFRLR